jgi:putative NADH-flavin reductase
MNVALIGANGFVGSALLAELLSRGHTVTALARDPAKALATAPEAAAAGRFKAVKADALDAAQVQAALAGQDALLSAYNPGWGNPAIYEDTLKATTAILGGLKAAGLKRLIVVGGAGSLFVAPGVQLVDTPEFPAEWKQGALGARDALKLVQQESTLDWTFVSPAVFLEPGPRTGQYRTGSDAPLMGSEGPARISTADLAVAIVDALEQGLHRQARFTVGY